MVSFHAILSWGLFRMPGERLLTGLGLEGFVSIFQNSPDGQKGDSVI
jgi:hypothetical protein